MQFDTMFDMGKETVKEWFIRIGSLEEGPYSVNDLKRDWRITPDTFVWKAGFSHWVPIRYVKELKEIFKDSDKDKDEEKAEKKDQQKRGQEVLALDYEPSHQFWLWLLIVLLILVYTLYKLNK